MLDPRRENGIDEGQEFFLLEFDFPTE